jgi:hypothetical protein
MMLLLGLQDDYGHDGRVLAEELEGFAVPKSVKKGGIFLPLARAYKEINAPVGPLGLTTLTASTKGLESGNGSDDSTYSNLEGQLDSITTQRNALAAQMIGLLEGAAFNGKDIEKGEARKLVDQAQTLMNDANGL